LPKEFKAQKLAYFYSFIIIHKQFFMRKSLLSVVLLSFFLSASFAQGVNFEQNTTWEAIVAKATKENKMIFVDAFTTWCGPCKWLDNNTFADAEVGKFMDKNFISLKVQMDTIKADTEYTRKWWAIGQEWNTAYGIAAYPTFLIFDSNGKIADRGVGALPSDKFIAKLETFQDKANHYYRLKDKYEAGDESPELLLKLTTKASESYDRKFMPIVSEKYIKTQSNLLTKENADILMKMDIKPGSEYFQFLVANKVAYAALLENPKAMDNFLLGKLVASHAKQLTPKNETVDWQLISDDLKKYVPNDADKFLTKMKINRYRSKKDWPAYADAVSNMVKAYPNEFSGQEINSMAWALFEGCNDLTCIEKSISWMEQSMNDGKNSAFLDTYANILYRTGKVEKAINTQTEAIALGKEAKEDTAELEATLDKMKKGEKTWE
jgi:thioredoxin-related protein